MPRARGSAAPIQKKNSHITLVLSGGEPVKKKKSKAVKVTKVTEVKEGVVKKGNWKDKDNSIKSYADKSLNKKIFRRKSI